MPSFKARIPSPRPLPSSGNFFGPNTSRAIKKMTSRWVGCNRPSNIGASEEFQQDHTLLEGRRGRSWGPGHRLVQPFQCFTPWGEAEKAGRAEGLVPKTFPCDLPVA